MGTCQSEKRSLGGSEGQFTASDGRGSRSINLTQPAVDLLYVRA